MLVLAVALVVALVSGGCSDGGEVSGTEPPKPSAPLLVQAPPELRAKCQATADAVGYAVPCPTRVPEGLTATRAIGRCELDIIGPGATDRKACGNAWRGWVIGSSETNDQHLVIHASPRPLRNAAKVVNGPAWYPGARVRPLRSLTINGWRMRAVYVPVKTNAGSAFMRHVVLIWTVRGHTYGIGFHKVHGLGATLHLDAALARGVRLIAPRSRSKQWRNACGSRSNRGDQIHAPLGHDLLRAHIGYARLGRRGASYLPRLSSGVPFRAP
jgi:hypothetical protein